MKIKIVKAKGNAELCTIEIDSGQLVDELKKQIAAKNWRVRTADSQHRANTLRVVLLGHKKISEFIGGSEATVSLKDLGPQLPYKMLFIIEYLGPLITIPILYLISGNKSYCAKFGAVMGFAHYFKRELESHFVHIFSNASVPVSGSIKNMVHYWFFYGVLTTVEIFFLKSSASDWNLKYYYFFAAIWTIFQFMNLKCHIILRNLRVGGDGSVDTHKRGIPKGYGFDTVHCANYLWEILGWVTYSIMTKSWASALFTILGVIPMLAWSKKKKKILLEAYANDEAIVNKLKRKPALFPGIA